MNRRKLERSEKRTKIIHLNIFFLKGDVRKYRMVLEWSKNDEKD